MALRGDAPGEGNGEGRDWTAAAGLAVENGSRRGVSGSWPRFVATLLMGYVLTALTPTMFDWWSVGSLQMQPLVVVIVSAGFRMPLVPGALITLFLGYLTDLCSGPPVGLQLTSYVIVLCCCAVAERKLDIASWSLQMLAVGLMSLLQQGLVMGGLILVYDATGPQWDQLAAVLGHSLLCALTAPLFFGALELLVRFLGRLIPVGGGTER